MEDFLYRFLSLFNKLPLPVRQSLGRIYQIIPARLKYGRFYSRYHSRLEFFSHLTTAAQINEEQGKLLVQQVNAAVESVPFYKPLQKLNTPEDIRHFPVITKKTILDHYEAFLNPQLKNKRLKANTGGSSGTPLEFYIEKDVSRPKEKAHFNWYWGMSGYKPGDPMLMVRGVPLQGNKTHEYRTVDNILNVSCFTVNETNILPVLDSINRFSPRFIHAYPSSLKVITSLLEPYRSRIEFKPRALFLGSEFLSTDDRKGFEAFYQAPAINWYGHSERLVHGGNCPYSGEYHFYPAYGYLELLDDNDNQVTAAGAEGRIVATGFDNRVMPFIRYDTGDMGILSGNNECSCGFRGTSLQKISGRGQDVILLTDGTRVSLTAFIFGQHLEAFDKIRELQVIQNKAGEVELAVVKSPGFTSKDEKSVMDTLSRSVNGKIKLYIRYVSSVSKTPRGKNIFFISKLDP